MKHTSGIWKVKHNQRNSSIVLEDNNEVSIATTGNWLDDEREEMRANAERIVRCVNNYDTLEKENVQLMATAKTEAEYLEKLESENMKLSKALKKASGLIDASWEEVKVSDNIWKDVIYSINEALKPK